MSWAFVWQDAIGATISFVVFTVCGIALAKWKLLPFWHEHKPAVLRALARFDDE